MNDFTAGVKKKLKSRASIYTIVFIVLLAAQKMYQAYQEEQALQEAATTVGYWGHSTKQSHKQPQPLSIRTLIPLEKMRFGPVT
ncbi:MAG: hypothetical protein ACJASY_002319 [Halioglobus sp.]|jgi:hypothetical protein